MRPVSNVSRVFRERARSRRSNSDLSRPLRLVSLPARLSLAAALVIIAGGALWLFGGHVAVKTSSAGVIVSPPGNTLVSTLHAGSVVRALPALGTPVALGEVLTEVRKANGQLESVLAPITGRVVSHSTIQNAAVSAGDALLTIAPDSEPMVGLLFPPARSISSIVPGLQVEVSVTTLDASTAGVLEGTVANVSPLPVTDERLALIIDDELLLEAITREGPVHEVIVNFNPDPAKPLGLAWSGSGPSRGVEVVSGSIIVGQFVLSEQSPWQALLGIQPDPPSAAPATYQSGPKGPQSLPVTARLRAGGTTVDLEVASTPTEQATGLMFRSSLAPNRGMLFRLPAPRAVDMWMRDTLIPLDIVYIKDGTIVGIEAQVPPCEDDPCPTYPSPTEIDAVIELASGRAAELGLMPGDLITIEDR